MLAKACATLAVIGTAAAYTPTLVSDYLWNIFLVICGIAFVHDLRISCLGFVSVTKYFLNFEVKLSRSCASLILLLSPL